jgi:Right handed beta helix region
MSHRLVTTLIAAACATIALSPAATALETILYISTTGNNANPCTLAQPCRSIQFAINRTPAGGEVRVLDPGFYGNNAKIKKSLTISGSGHTVTLGTPLTVNDAAATVALRGLVLNGEDNVQYGIHIQAAKSVHIERCTVHNFIDAGIYAGTVDVNLFVSGSIARNNGQRGLVFDSATNGFSKLTVDNSLFVDNGFVGMIVADGQASITRTTFAGNVATGLQVLAGGVANVTSSTAANNGGDGYRVVGGNFTLESSVARGNGAAGVYSHFSNDVVRLSNSVITNNVIGLRNGGMMLTRGNNTVDDNTTPLVGNALDPLAAL